MAIEEERRAIRRSSGSSSDIPDPIPDAVIIGAGPAGVSCAVWLVRLGFAPLLLEAADRVGGLCLGHRYHDNWNASLPARTGLEVAAQLALSVQQARVNLKLNTSVARLEQTRSGFVVTAACGAAWRAPYVVLASGVRARRLAELKELEETQEKTQDNKIVHSAEPLPGVLIGPGGHVAAQDFCGKRVAVLGGGDNAFENALHALDHGAALVNLYARSVRAQQQFVRRFVSATRAVSPSVPPSSVHPSAHLHGMPATLNLAQRQVNGQPFDLILVCYGWQPCLPFLAFADTPADTPAFPPALARTPRGFIQTDWATAQTNVPGLYAIGEVAHRQHPCVVTALADGVTAAKAIQHCLEADLENNLPPRAGAGC